MQRRSFNSLMLAGAGGLAAAACTKSSSDVGALASDCTSPPSAAGISEQDFRSYIDAFNRSDFDSFGKFYSDNVEFIGRGRHFRSRDEVLAFYREVKSRMRETITVKEVVVGDSDLMAEIETELVANVDWPEFVTGPVKKGDVILTQNFAWYEIENGKFVRIRSARYRKLK
ncbi:MAG: nuclear transport factor 2 family protein [Pseudomonadota bacterium]